jgi:DNA polymerase-3 subunit epsilon
LGAEGTLTRRYDDRIAATAWARQMIADPAGWVLLDTETTGLSGSDEVIQVGVLAPDGKIVFNSLVRPALVTAIPEAAARVHRIRMEHLADAPGYREIVDDLAAITAHKLVVAYNAEFDSRLLAQSARAAGIGPLEARWECAMKQYSRYVGDWDSSRCNYRYQRLPSAAHDAIGDCRATLAIIRTMAMLARSRF